MSIRQSDKRFSRAFAWFGKTTTGNRHRNPFNRAGLVLRTKPRELSPFGIHGSLPLVSIGGNLDGLIVFYSLENYCKQIINISIPA